MTAKLYKLAEIFYSLQGEGMRQGEASVFVRFAGCNLCCKKEEAGFDCDTNHERVTSLDVDGVVNSILDLSSDCRWVVLTGGEPSLQLDSLLIARLKGLGLLLAIETNGTRALPPGLDWITISPKKGELVRQPTAHEVKYVLKAGDPLPLCEIKARHKFLSPAFEGDKLPTENLNHCIKLCLENPAWRLSMQAHKRWGIP